MPKGQWGRHTEEAVEPTVLIVEYATRSLTSFESGVILRAGPGLGAVPHWSTGHR